MKKILQILLVTLLFSSMSEMVFGQKVLFFRDATLGTDRMEEALIDLGLDYTKTADNNFFRTELAQVGKYQYAIYFAQNAVNTDAASVSVLNAFHSAGGKIIYDDWTRNNALGGLFGVSYTGSINFYSTTIITPALQAGLPSNPIFLTNPGWRTFSTGMAALSGFTVNGVFPNGEASIISNAAKTSFVVGFLGDTPPFYHIYKNLLLNLGVPAVFTNSLASATFCPGESTSITVTVTSGVINAGNIFTAQLSDASGDFTSAVSIGTLAGTGSGSITATIPANTVAGSGYRLRVISSDPAITGTDNGADLTVNPLITYYADTDEDGFGDANSTTQDCSAPTGYVANATDCDDTDASTYPGAAELCDGKDHNCDGIILTIPTANISVTPTSNVYTGGIPNNIYLGYGPQSVRLTATGGISYSWSPATGLSNLPATDPALTSDPIFTPTTQGNYTFTVTTTNADGCTDTENVIITVINAVSGNKGDKVLVCHNGNEIRVSPNAVPAQLSHIGSKLGPCNPVLISARVANAAVQTPLAFTSSLVAYPNPFTTTSNIEITLAKDGMYKAELIDMKGQLIKVIAQEEGTAGATYGYEVGNTNLAAGMYMIRLVSASEVKYLKLMLHK